MMPTSHRVVAPEKGPSADEFSSRCVLVVDDEPDIVYILTRALRSAGYKVFEAFNVASAWKLLQENSINIIVCDIMMPDVSGLDLCRRVKQNPHLQQCHFILLTAKGWVQDRVAGLNTGADDYVPKPFNIAELLARVRAGERITSSRRRLQEISVTDPLTGLYSRRVLWPFLETELARARRYDFPLSMLVVDIDFFKRFNDTYGHLAGDEALRQVGELIRSRLRRSDVAVRFGGEEFVLLLPQTDPQGAETLGRWLCQAVRSCRFSVNGKPVPLTISIGLAALADSPDATPEELFARADAAMYQAKHTGRDRLFCAQAGTLDTAQPSTGPSAEQGAG
ncbi:MAG: diguanylate cyclase [Phycisphaerae bacterium]|nr:diguanylate cyclase [Phycisphaerae bacterium]